MAAPSTMPAPNRMPALSVKGLTKIISTTPAARALRSRSGRVDLNQPDFIFKELDFNIQTGESVAIIGPNGAGKSTLLRCCLSLIQPDLGTVHLHGKQISQLSGSALRKARQPAALIFQKHQLVTRLPVLSNVIHGALGGAWGPRYWLHSLASSETRLQAYQCLEQVGLADLAMRRCDQLSGGQSQRIAIARALMQKPKLLFADEPTASLDPHSGREIMELFRALQRSLGLTIVFVSHDLQHALNYSDRIIALKDSRLALDTRTRNETHNSLARLFSDNYHE
ncbi:MAG: ATP-binding cassette domain-containing protein [Pseudomonadales bacterium]|nr:ATP-binding cassette domain-containing protein [Pseudomonadales bacterium]